MKITDVVLDFDGTCTQIPPVYEKFMNDYLTGINQVLPAQLAISPQTWNSTVAELQQYSPVIGWTVSVTPSAPAAADPYILSGETAKYVFKYLVKTTIDVPLAAFTTAYGADQAPWRVEALSVIQALTKKNIAVHIVSNSSPVIIAQRLQDLWGGATLPASITFNGNASKYNITEPSLQDNQNWSADFKKLFGLVPVEEKNVKIGRPIYLRRGAYASIIAKLLNNNINKLSGFVFCGDIWELDLALPAVLGGKVHLIERAEPFNTYEYEKKLAKHYNGKMSRDLMGLLDWV